MDALESAFTCEIVSPGRASVFGRVMIANMLTGAMQNCTLDCSTPAILAQTLDTSEFNKMQSDVESAKTAYVTELNLTFPKYSKPFDISSRLKLFYEQPIVFHGFTVASAVHRDVLRNEPCLSSNREIIAHRGKLLTLLNALLNDLADDDVELAILSILLVTLADLDWYKLQGDPILPFRPHMASANWINVFGRVMSVGRGALHRPYARACHAHRSARRLEIPQIARTRSPSSLVSNLTSLPALKS